MSIEQLTLIALATLVTEDLNCIATGLLVAQGQVNFFFGTAACLLGIFAGDLLLFLAGRFAGRPALRFVSAEKIERASAWLSAKGMIVVFLSRFMPGLRLPTYVAAGLLKTNFWRFTGYFLAAAAAWTPLLVGASALFGGEILRRTRARAGAVLLAFAVALALVLLLRKVLIAAFSFRARRAFGPGIAPRVSKGTGRRSPLPIRSAAGIPLATDGIRRANAWGYYQRRSFVGFALRKIRWEFWPAWAAYAPVAPYLLYLACKHRSLTLFTAANPGISSGGFVGESKSQIIENLSRREGSVARFAVIPGSLASYARDHRAAEFLARENLSFPVVLKPDVGERGSGVAIVRTNAEMEAYIRAAVGDTIIQEYIAGLEFGVFYYRYPGEAAGRIFSITQKLFPEVIGDGRSSLETLILRDPRAVCMAGAYFRASKRRLDDVPAAGERVPLVELGSHCRGAVFLDGTRLNTRALEQAVDAASKSHPGFYLGRFDIRTPSVQALQRGDFKVIELNGVSAEATHIYDPAVSLLEAYRVMRAQWRIAFEIGAINRRLGAEPMPAQALLALIRDRRRRKPQTVAPPVARPIPNLS